MRTFGVFPVMEYSNSAASNGVIMGGIPLKIDATLPVIVSDFLCFIVPTGNANISGSQKAEQNVL